MFHKSWVYGYTSRLFRSRFLNSLIIKSNLMHDLKEWVSLFWKIISSLASQRACETMQGKALWTFKVFSLNQFPQHYTIVAHCREPCPPTNIKDSYHTSLVNGQCTNKWCIVLSCCLHKTHLPRPCHALFLHTSQVKTLLESVKYNKILVFMGGFIFHMGFHHHTCLTWSSSKTFLYIQSVE